MKRPLSDAAIVAARPANYQVNAEFTHKVMRSIESSEILSSRLRKMSVNNKETLFMKLRHLPKFAIIAIALGALVLLSGTAYAAYQLLWPKPDVQVSKPATSVSGRQEVSLSLAQCGDANLGSRYELKSNATIDAEDVPMVVKAQCELGAINTWAQATYPHDDTFGAPPTGRAYDSTRVTTSMATYIKSRAGSSITFAGLEKYNQTDTAIPFSTPVRYIADGKDVADDIITGNDPVAYITSEKSHMVPNGECTKTSCSMTGTTSEKVLLAVVKLSLPFEYYDQYAWQSLTERQACIGNPEDSCLTGYAGAIDLFNGNTALTTGDVTTKEIQGVITNLSSNTITIRSSSGAAFTINTPTNVVAEYNTNKAARYYNNQTVEVGSSLIVRYVEKAGERSKNLNPNSLISIQLQIELVRKGDPIKSY